MSNLQAEVTLDWGDGTYLFRLSVSNLLELEEKCSAPFTVIFQRLAGGAYSISDLRETIRLGLIGGGTDPARAMKLIKSYVDDAPKGSNLPVARAILGATLFGFAAEPLGNQKAAPTDSPSASTPPASTKPLPSSEISRLATSIASRFGSGQQP